MKFKYEKRSSKTQDREITSEKYFFLFMMQFKHEIKLED